MPFFEGYPVSANAYEKAHVSITISDRHGLLALLLQLIRLYLRCAALSANRSSLYDIFRVSRHFTNWFLDRDAGFELLKY